MLIDIYRNGAVHSFYPKECSIRNDNKNIEILSYGNDIYHLNVNPLAVLLIERFRNYVSDSGRDHNEVKRLTKRINTLLSVQRIDFEKHKSNLPNFNTSHTSQSEITTTFPISSPQETDPPVW